MMPVYTAGDLEGMTGVTEQRLKEDITVFTTILEDPAQGEKIWKKSVLETAGKISRRRCS